MDTEAQSDPVAQILKPYRPIELLARIGVEEELRIRREYPSADPRFTGSLRACMYACGTKTLESYLAYAAVCDSRVRELMHEHIPSHPLSEALWSEVCSEAAMSTYLVNVLVAYAAHWIRTDKHIPKRAYERASQIVSEQAMGNTSP